MSTQPEHRNASEHLEPVTKNESGRITWLVDDWPKDCLLYTTPPQRTWVGLTHQERNAIRGKYWIGMSDAVFDDIEAKLKAKNERKEKNTHDQ